MSDQTPNSVPGLGRLFVYGTLRPGSLNEHAELLARSAHHAGAAAIRGRLFRVTHYLALVAAEEDTEWVNGDVFEGVPRNVMQTLDKFEGA